MQALRLRDDCALPAANTMPVPHPRGAIPDFRPHFDLWAIVVASRAARAPWMAAQSRTPDASWSSKLMAGQQVAVPRSSYVAASHCHRGILQTVAQQLGTRLVIGERGNLVGILLDWQAANHTHDLRGCGRCKLQCTEATDHAEISWEYR